MGGAKDEKPRQSVALIATAGGDSLVKLWKVEEQEEEQVARKKEDEGPVFTLANDLEGHSEKVTCVAFSPDKRLVASASFDKSVILWKTESGSRHMTMAGGQGGHREGVTALAFDKTGEILATGSWDNRIQLRSVESAQTMATLKGHIGAVTALAFSPNGRFLASASRDGTVRLWNTKQGEIGTEPVAVLERHSGVVTCVDYSGGDGALLATGGHDKKVLLWETESLTGASSRPVSQAPEEKGREAGGAPGGVTNLAGHEDYVLAVAFPPTKSKLLASAGADKRCIIWNTEPGAPKTKLMVLENDPAAKVPTGHMGPINAIGWSSDATMLVSASRDRSTRVWQILPREIDGDELWSSTCVCWIQPHGKETLGGHTMNIEDVAVAFEPLEVVEVAPVVDMEEEDIVEVSEPAPVEGEQAAVEGADGAEAADGAAPAEAAPAEAAAADGAGEEAAEPAAN